MRRDSSKTDFNTDNTPNDGYEPALQIDKKITKV
jgi:hypothetical protein